MRKPANKRGDAGIDPYGKGDLDRMGKKLQLF